MFGPPAKQQKTAADQTLLPIPIGENRPEHLHGKRKAMQSRAMETFLTGFLQTDKESATKLFTSKIYGRQLILDDARTVNVDEKEENKKKKRLKSRKKRILSRSKRAEVELATSALPKPPIRYEEFNTIHNLWNEYIREYVGNNKGTQAAARLVKADFHGALLVVTRCPNPSIIGQQGIVIKETMNTFNIVTKENRVKVLPKAKTHFSFVIGQEMFTIFGDHFCFRSADRSTRKYKYKPFVNA